MKIDRAIAQISGTTTTIYTATKDGEIIFSLLATSAKPCNLYLTRLTSTAPNDYFGQIVPWIPWKLPGKIVLRSGESFVARVMEVNPIDWHSLPDWDTSPSWDYPGEIFPVSPIANIDLSVIQI